MVVFILFLLLSAKFPKVSKQLLVNNNTKRPNSPNQKTHLFGEGKKQIANAGKSNRHSSSLGNLCKDVFEPRTLTGSELSSFLGSSLGGGFCPKFDANRLYKSMDREKIKFGSVRAYYKRRTHHFRLTGGAQNVFA